MVICTKRSGRRYHSVMNDVNFFEGPCFCIACLRTKFIKLGRVADEIS